MNALFWGSGYIPASYSNWDTSWNAWNRHSGSFIVNTGMLVSNMKSSSHECWMTFWSLTNSDFSIEQTFHQFPWHWYRSWPLPMQRLLHAIRESLLLQTHGSVSFLVLACAPMVETRFLEHALYFFNFSPWIPLGTFSIFIKLRMC